MRKVNNRRLIGDGYSYSPLARQQKVPSTSVYLFAKGLSKGISFGNFSDVKKFHFKEDHDERKVQAEVL